MTGDNNIIVRELTADDLPARIADLGAILTACVHDGASVGFILPFTAADGEAFWRDGILAELRAGGLVLLVAERDGRTVGTVQLDHATKPNQRHRAEVRKLLVHPDARRGGIATRLMAEIERRAKELGRTLLTLDTRTGDGAEPLYLGLGYEIAGRIPDFCRDTITDRLDPTTILYKRI